MLLFEDEMRRAIQCRRRRRKGLKPVKILKKRA